jgi:hypothetical protein
MTYDEALRYAVENINAFGVPALICRPHWLAAFLLVNWKEPGVVFLRYPVEGSVVAQRMPWTPAPHDRLATDWTPYKPC